MSDIAESKFPADNSSNQPFLALNIADVALESAQVGIWIIDRVTKDFLPSSRTKELFGFLPDEDMSFADSISQVADKHKETVIKAFENAFKGNHNLYLEFPVIDRTQHKNRWLSVTGGFSNQDAISNYFSGIVMDITEQKQNDLRRSKFIGMVSHELKTPLTALKAYVQMLNNWAKKQKDSFTIGALSKVDKQVRKMLNMINSLLNLSGAEAGKIHLNKTEFILDQLINEVVEETLFITSSHNIVVVPCDMITINADRDKIEQVLVNLLSNAAKYSDKASPIEIGCALKGEAVEISITDDGLGIAPEDIAKLFLPHYRVESKETEKIAGFGIGLYLCSEIVQKHGGKIWVESELGKGSTFKFTVPLN
ncbi:sensor histidine kinase [Mucilaginibacter glaciei]|uniref:histidine kinase n=1 Tax=Mucilaginibacter glaciei TaxID=2772109 RepID=A0A926S288_9SPHI|nr:PAS domain-containing sensor histidine kinase [Mucilaginibacter glaciei]MBD1392949.1 PAS domain-containing sensor histidine kinase [Mucilaginibacter glaciei]